MRKNVVRVFRAWVNNRSCRTDESIWTDGAIIFSYVTPIVVRHPDGKVVLNEQRYSPTTSRQQSSLRLLLEEYKLIEPRPMDERRRKPKYSQPSIFDMEDTP